MDEQEITGGCACGAVRYRTAGAVEFAFHCYCRKCQRATGGGHASALAVAATQLRIDGRIESFGQPSDSGAKTWSGFCPVCGSPLTSRTERFPDRIYLHAGSLDNPERFVAEFVVFAEQALPWDPPAD